MDNDIETNIIIVNVTKDIKWWASFFLMLFMIKQIRLKKRKSFKVCKVFNLTFIYNNKIKKYESTKQSEENII